MIAKNESRELLSLGKVREKERKRECSQRKEIFVVIYISYIILDFVATLLANCNWIDEIYNSDL